MAVVRTPNSPALHFPTSSRLPHCALNPILYSTSRPASCCCLNVQNCGNSSQFPVNLRQKLIPKHESLNDLPSIDVSLVSKVIRECADDGSFMDAILMYIEMLECGVSVENFHSFPCLIKAFGGLSDVKKGCQIYGHVLKLGILDDIYVTNSLLALFWKCRAGEIAVQIFEKMHERDSVSWSTMITGFRQSGCFLESLTTLYRMIWEFEIYPNRIACISALSSCASLEYLIHGREIHGFVLRSGLDVDEFVVNGLIEMYMKCRDVTNAEYVFSSHVGNDLVRRNSVIWNVMILGYVSNVCWSKALHLFIEMLMLGTKPDSSTMVATLVLCSQMMDIVVGRQIHCFVFRIGLENDVRVLTALIDMYFKCGDSQAALKVFERYQNRNLVMWGAVISNCAQGYSPIRALELFCTFRLEGGFADPIIYLAVLRACSLLTLNAEGMEIHGLIVKLGFDSDIFIGGALVDMYAKCRDMESAQKVFISLPERDLVSWNALISGYAQNECSEEAINAFRDMQSEKMRPNAVTFAYILSVCAYLSVMNLCKEVHAKLTRQGLELNVLVNNSLIATYAKCGDINSARAIFERMAERNEVSWNSVILGFGMHGHADEVFVLFEKMKASGVKPDHITFTAVLSACSHTGRVDEGWKYFESMVEDYKLEPLLEQYTCMVDLLGRVGDLNQAYDLIMTMPCAPDYRIWGSLLGSCSSHGNERLAEVVANHIFKLDPASIGYRVLLANLYEDFGKQNEVTRLRSEIKDTGLKKRPGCSWIEIDNKIHIFTAGDKSHYHTEDIYATIENLTTQIEGRIYSLDTFSCCWA